MIYFLENYYLHLMTFKLYSVSKVNRQKIKLTTSLISSTSSFPFSRRISFPAFEVRMLKWWTLNQMLFGSDVALRVSIENRLLHPIINLTWSNYYSNMFFQLLQIDQFKFEVLIEMIFDHQSENCLLVNVNLNSTFVTNNLTIELTRKFVKQNKTKQDETINTKQLFPTT